jgi:hypothetical protein
MAELDSRQEERENGHMEKRYSSKRDAVVVLDP